MMMMMILNITHRIISTRTFLKFSLSLELCWSARAVIEGLPAFIPDGLILRG